MYPSCAAATTIEVSVVLSTYNRAALLGGALDALMHQCGSDTTFELIVVDNNSGDDTKRVLESFQHRGAGNFRTAFEPRQGLSYGLNTGIGLARGKIIAFTDDDMRVADDYVARIKAAFDRYPDAAFIGGRVLPRYRQEPPGWLTQDHWAPLALQDYGDEPFCTSATRPICLLNKAFRKEVFREYGLLRPEMGRTGNSLGSAEDHDLMLRIWHAGGTGVYIPDVIAFADVQDERVTKSYHRRWHSGHGQFASKLPLATGDSAPATLFGVPLKVYRKLVSSIWGWLTSLFRDNDSLTFFHETRIRYASNYLRSSICDSFRRVGCVASRRKPRRHGEQR